MPSAEWVKMPSRVALMNHTHSSSHILVVLDGEIYEDGRIYRAGDIRISTADDRHFLRFTQPAHCLIVEGVGPAVSVGSRRVLRIPGLVTRLRAATAAEHAIELAGARDLSDALGDSQPPAWLRELEHRRAEGGFVGSKSVEAVARMAGVSREHLARSYHRHFGTSVTDAIRVRRLRAAYDAVTGSGQSLAEVADRCGFSDQSHMTRHFVDWIGITPGVLRRGKRDVTSVQDTNSAIAVQSAS
jgi:AraC-like DNA-binding protein